MIIYPIEDENIEIWVGQNAQDNWDILSQSKQTEIWLHLDKLSSPYVIIKDSNPSKYCLNYAASICKKHSKYYNLNKVNVIYTQIKNIKKGSEIGSAIVKGKTKKITI